jgi:acetyl-CoA carboxylase alpha subunit
MDEQRAFKVRYSQRENAAQLLAKQLRLILAELEPIAAADLLEQRYAKFRRIGCFSIA